MGDFLQPRVGASGLPGAADPPPTVLAVDVTGDAGDLAALQAALLEVRGISRCTPGCNGLRVMLEMVLVAGHSQQLISLAGQQFSQCWQARTAVHACICWLEAMIGAGAQTYTPMLNQQRL